MYNINDYQNVLVYKSHTKVFWGHNIVLRKELCKQKVFKMLKIYPCNNLCENGTNVQLETAVKCM